MIKQLSDKGVLKIVELDGTPFIVYKQGSKQSAPLNVDEKAFIENFKSMSNA